MTCPECAKAEANPLHPVYIAECEGCGARMLACGTELFESRLAKEMTPAYRSSLEARFGAAWEQGHAAVKAWHDRITKARRNWREVRERAE